MIEKGFCQCGCGQRTKISKCNYPPYGWVKGEPFRYIHGHKNIGYLNGMWKGGSRIASTGYTIIAGLEKRSDGKRHAFEHTIRAEKALGKPLSKKANIHHFPKLSNYTHIIICQDMAYHRLLELRYRALKGCGNVHRRKCTLCKQWDSQDNLYHNKNSSCFNHRHCKNEYDKSRRLRIS